MKHSSEKAAVLLMPYSKSKQQRILSLLMTTYASNIRKKLVKAESLALCVDDFSQKKLPLSVFNCKTKADVELVRLHVRDTENQLCTSHTKQVLLSLVSGGIK
jgi:hypothetical protein